MQSLATAWRAHPAPRLWTSFVLGWVFVLAIAGNVLVRDAGFRSRLPEAVLALVLLGALFLWVTLREGVIRPDLTGRPSRADLRRRLGLLSAMAAVVVTLVLLIPHAEPWWLTMHVVVAAGLALPPRLSVVVISVATAATVVAGRLIAGYVDPFLPMLIVFGAAAAVIRQLTISVAQLRAARAEVARAAVDQERLRFARDLHDLLGHTLSVIVLKSELAGRLLPASPSLAADEIGDVERSAREALRQVREAVVGYRQPVLESELTAARELLPAAGIEVSIDHSAGPLPPALDGLLAWSVREGVINVIRHSRARHCVIRVRRVNTHAELTVSDDGRGSPPDAAGTGNGLAGLRERAAACRAEVQAGPKTPNGYLLTITVPVTDTVSP